jgi:LuxR family maltose regulon positive regulatory protein
MAAAGPGRLSLHPGLAEPLTGREHAVLRLLTGTLSLREIANVMYVSPNTVKTHTQAVYRKLGVSGRKDAVAEGRRLGLL